MVIRVISVPDDTELTDLHEIFQTILGWSLHLGYSFLIQGKEFKSFRCQPRSQLLRECHLHRHETFRYLADPYGRLAGGQKLARYCRVDAGLRFLLVAQDEHY